MHATGPANAQDTTQGSAPPVSSAVDGSRPFGAHLRMSWWKPLVIIFVPSLALIVLQVLLYQVVGVIEGSDDPMAPASTPLKFLAVNVATGMAGVLAILLLVWLAKVPWRSLISSPIQAAGEELMFRSAMLPAAASWVRSVRPALAVGLVVSGLGFAAVHGSTDPWLFGYFVLISVATGVMAIISRGIEAPVAFHVANNVLFTTVNTLMAGGEAFAIDRSNGSGDAYGLEHP